MLTRDWFDRIPVDFEHSRGTSVDLGCGRMPRNPLKAQRLIGIDIIDMPEPLPGVEYLRTDVGDSLPLSSSTVSVVTAFDFLEHLPRTYQSANGTATNLFIQTMNEVHRVLQPNGLFVGVTPAFPRPAAFEDPTHVNPIGMETVHYFAGPSHALNLGYGYTGHFDIIAHGWLPRSSPWYDRSVVEHHPQAEGQTPGDRIGFRPRADRSLHRAREQLRPVIHRLAPWGARRPFHVLWVLRKAPD